eukprot:GFUD01118173.1.p1 GENE.GFUD01118173.1~~GFUD01118173.1.p1  ORF type:complete len:116 (+),score=44.38 GFUD01118173.1:35-349(+)
MDRVTSTQVSLANKIVEVDQCFVCTDPTINQDEFFKMVEQQLLERIRKMEEMNASIECIEEDIEVQTKVIALKDKKENNAASSVIGWGTFFNDHGRAEKREFVR